MRKLEILLISVCLMVTVLVYSDSVQRTHAAAQEEFNRQAEDSVQAIQTRMSIYLQSLRGASAFLKSSDLVSREDFDSYVDVLDIDEALPGISGIGFIRPVVRGQEQDFLDELAMIGETGLQMKPETDGPERFIIERISPLEPNLAALGLDITFEEGRRNAALAARETGTPQLTPRILLVQDQTKQPGFLLLNPVYAKGADAQKAAVLPELFKGWVYAPFVGRDLLTNLVDHGRVAYNFAVYDGLVTEPDAVIYDSAFELNDDPVYQARFQIEQFGRTWTVLYGSTPRFEAFFRSYLPLGVLLAGLLISAMLFATFRVQRIRSEAMAELAAFRSRQINAREEENRSVVENAVIAVFILDEERRIRYVNQAGQDTFGYGAAEIRGMAFDALTTEVKTDFAEEEFNATGRTKTGDALVLDLQCNSWVTHEGEGRITAIVRDVTAEIEAVSELKKTKTIYDLALKGSQIGVFDVDLIKGTSEVTDTWLEIMGYDPDHPVTDTQTAFLKRVHPDDLSTLKTADQMCIEGRASRSISEFRLRFPNEEWRWMRSDAVVVERDATGSALRMIGTQTDVTDLRHSRNALEASETRFRQVVSAAPIGMALVNGEGEFLDVNDAFCNLSGHSRDATLGGRVQLQDMMPPDDLKSIYRDVMHLVEGTDGEVYRGEHRILRPDGAECWGLFNISWTYDRNADSNFFIVQVNNITDQKELEQIKNEFVSTVSHELRTPLTSIKGALGLIHASDDQGLSAGSKRLIDIARSNTDRLTTIVNDILDLEKISSGEVTFHFDTYDISQIIEEAVKEMSPFAVTHNNTIKVDVPDGPLRVMADHGRTKQVLANLMSNACKYSEDDSTVTIKAEQLDDVAIIYVQNNGVGIPEAFRPRLFQAFSQADSSDTRAKGGTGLGLNITKQIVTRHQGKIGFESVPGSFTVFWFTIPLSDAVGQTDRSVTQETRRGDDRKLRVLHLEDDVDFAEVIKSGLASVADVTLVGSLASARRTLQDHEFDVAIVDWSLPDGDATQFVDEMLDANPDLRVLGLSADADVRGDSRLYANLVKSRTELDTIAAYVSGRIARAS